jgi:hypothetical protein
MIRDKNIFECIVKDNHIYFPDYVIWSPPSHGMQRRQHIFKLAFPEMESSINSSFRWKTLRKRHYEKRRLFEYKEDTKLLSEINKSSFFITGFGYPINIGETIETSLGRFVITKLSVISHAGLIASYMKDGEEKKVNVSFFERESKNHIWKKRKQNESKD